MVLSGPKVKLGYESRPAILAGKDPRHSTDLVEYILKTCPNIVRLIGITEF